MIYVLVIIALIKLYAILNIYQQSHYNIKQYSIYFLKNILFYSISLFIPVLLSFIFKNQIFTIITIIFLLCYSILFVRFKVKLKFTKRIIRLLVISIIYLILISFINYANLYLLIFKEFTIIPLLYFESFISFIINSRFIKKAKAKIKDYKGTKIIITGSYGKTSTKLLFDQILKIYASTSITPKSYNTPLGISKYINKEAIDAYRNIVLEFGASHKNDISKLLKIVEPDVAVVTEIGYMHMNGFKTINNVVEEKMKIINNAKIAILNYDNKYIREYKKNNQIILSYGFSYGDFNARNVSNGSFDFYYKNKLIKHFNTKLIGRHQILNLLAVLSYIYYLGYDLNRLNKALMLIRIDNNRLELKKYDNKILLDDSFNSNYQGFVSALNIIGKIKMKRFLITPGIVELGRYKRSIYIKLAKEIIKNIDIIILVKKDMYKYLKNKGRDIYIMPSFKAAYKKYLELSRNSYSALLIENDLPDIYMIRGII